MIYLPIDCAFSSFSVNFFIQSACVGRHPAFILCHTVRRVLKQTNKQTNQNPCYSVLFCKSIHQTPLTFHTANSELRREGHLESRIALSRQRRASRSNCSNSCQKGLQYFKLAQSSFNGQLQPTQSTNQDLHGYIFLKCLFSQEPSGCLEESLGSKSYRCCGLRLLLFTVLRLRALGYAAFCKNMAGRAGNKILNSKIKANVQILPLRLLKIARSR